MTNHTSRWKVTTMALGLIASAAVITIIVVTGCNTMEGVGKDIKKGGQAIEDSADKHK